MNTTRLILCILLTALIWTMGCIAPTQAINPLEGWHLCFSQDPSKLDKAISNDYKQYIQKFENKNHISPILLFEDGTGQHAVDLEVFEQHKNASWHYVIIYDKENKRSKIIKCNYTRYMS